MGTACLALGKGAWYNLGLDLLTQNRKDLVKNHMPQLEFGLVGDYVELNQLLKLAGVCDSGGAGKMRVAAGDVSVDGKLELRKTCKIRVGQVVSVGDARISVLVADPHHSGS